MKEVPETEFKILRRHRFDRVIIPTTGYIDCYDNVVAFAKNIFTTESLFYHRYPGEFITSEQSSMRELEKMGSK